MTVQALVSKLDMSGRITSVVLDVELIWDEKCKVEILDQQACCDAIQYNQRMDLGLRIEYVVYGSATGATFREYYATGRFITRRERIA